MMSTNTPLSFEEFLEDCFNDALAKVREAFRTTVFGLNDTELDGKLNAEFPNWCAGVIETCWCNLIAVYEGCVFTSADGGAVRENLPDETTRSARSFFPDREHVIPP